MMNFQQLCEFMTCDKRYSHFTCDQWVLDLFSAEDKSIAAIEKLRSGYSYVWYPKEKYKVPKLTTVYEIDKRLDIAIELGNLDMVRELGKQLKELKNENNKA